MPNALKPNWLFPLFATCAVCDEPLQFDVDPNGTPGLNGDWGTIGENGGDYGCSTGDEEGCDGHTPTDIEWRPPDMPEQPADNPDSVKSTQGLSATCKHCGRGITPENGAWVDPNATGDDAVWRETCDSHDTFTAEHEPASDPALLDAVIDEATAMGLLGDESTLPIAYVKDGHPSVMVEPEGTVTQGDSRFAQFPNAAEACEYLESVGWRRVIRRCSSQVHYGTVGPKYHNGPNTEHGWQGYCGRETTNRIGVCDECIADWNDNYPQNPIKATDDPPPEEENT